MYGTMQSMIDRFGNEQITRLSRPADRAATSPDQAKVELALADNSSLIDTYLRLRYIVPIAVPPPEIIRAASVLARYDLAQSQSVAPSPEMASQRKEILDWLKALSDGNVTLDIPTVAPAAETSSAGFSSSGSMHSDRDVIFSHETLRNM